MIHAAAIRFKGILYTLPKPARHVEIIVLIHRDKENSRDFIIPNAELGFIDDKGKFLNREKAGQHALDCGQVSELHVGNELYSEEIW